MPKVYPSVILLINQLKETGEKQFSVFGSRGGQNSPQMHVPLCFLMHLNWRKLLKKLRTIAYIKVTRLENILVF